MNENNEARKAKVQRFTNEVRVEVELNLDGSGNVDVTTGLPFLDHMISALGKHARFDLALKAEGDLEVDDHHTVEDCALALGQAMDQALGDKRGITRFGYAFVPLDEALARAVVDLSGRPWPNVELRLVRESLGSMASENLTHFMNSLAIEARMALHVNLLCGSNDHHKAEAAFKALAVALRNAVRRDGDGIPSTKGAL